MENIRQSWQMFVGSLSDEEVKFIIETGRSQNLHQGKVFEDSLSQEVRSSKISWIEQNNDHIKNILLPYIHHANIQALHVNLNGNAEIQYTEYHASEGGHYDWHGDVDWNEGLLADRKLSMTVQLSDPSEYEGGQFEFGEVECPNEYSRVKGTVLVFPSYLTHRVTPVTKGVRKSLVSWWWGPRWR